MARLAKHHRVTLPALRLASVIGFFLAWEMVSRSGLFSAFLLPAPTAILDYLWSDFVSGQLVINLRLTLGRMFAGYCIVALIGVPLGICVARVALVRWFFFNHSFQSGCRCRKWHSCPSSFFGWARSMRQSSR
jgi:ABC-type nitrate/sulfonate/bicarbonate transport system permease component